MSESGLHGAFMLDSSFNVDILFDALNIEEAKNQVSKKYIEDELKNLKKSKSAKIDSAFVRSISTFRSERKMFNFRVSLIER